MVGLAATLAALDRRLRTIPALVPPADVPGALMSAAAALEEAAQAFRVVTPHIASVEAMHAMNVALWLEARAKQMHALANIFTPPDAGAEARFIPPRVGDWPTEPPRFSLTPEPPPLPGRDP
jgi:hypothetical protein